MWVYIDIYNRQGQVWADIIYDFLSLYAWIQVFALFSKINCSTAQGKGMVLINSVSTHTLLLTDPFYLLGTLGMCSLIHISTRSPFPLPGLFLYTLWGHQDPCLVLLQSPFGLSLAHVWRKGLEDSYGFDNVLSFHRVRHIQNSTHPWHGTRALSNHTLICVKLTIVRCSGLWRGEAGLREKGNHILSISAENI